MYGIITGRRQVTDAGPFDHFLHGNSPVNGSIMVACYIISYHLKGLPCPTCSDGSCHCCLTPVPSYPNIFVCSAKSSLPYDGPQLIFIQLNAKTVVLNRYNMINAAQGQKISLFNGKRANGCKKKTNIASSSPAAVRDQEKTQEEDRQQNI